LDWGKKYSIDLVAQKEKQTKCHHPTNKISSVGGKEICSECGKELGVIC